MSHQALEAVKRISVDRLANSRRSPSNSRGKSPSTRPQRPLDSASCCFVAFSFTQNSLKDVVIVNEKPYLGLEKNNNFQKAPDDNTRTHKYDWTSTNMAATATDVMRNSQENVVFMFLLHGFL